MRTLFLRVAVCLVLALLTLTLPACDSATPISAPTLALPTQLPPTVPQLTPTVAPTIQPTPSAEASPVATATKFAIAVPTATWTPTAPPRPSAPTGRIAYTVVTGPQPKFHAIWVANANGTGARQILTHGLWPALSPDGTRIAYYGRPEGKSEGLYIANADGGNPVLIVIDPGVCCLNWSSDGNWIVYTLSPRPNQPGGPISMVKIDGAYKTIVPLNVAGNGPAFSPDSKQVIYSGCPPNTSTCGLIVVSTGNGAVRQISTDNGGNADWSSRGIVYQATDNAGHRQVYFINPDGSGKRQLTNGKSNDGQPAWSRDGGSIFWRSDQNGSPWAIYVMNADGSNPRKIVDNVPPSPDFWGWESISAGP